MFSVASPNNLQIGTQAFVSQSIILQTKINIDYCIFCREPRNMSESRPTMFNPSQGLSHSFSMASLAEGSSEPISEAEEINEVRQKA